MHVVICDDEAYYREAIKLAIGKWCDLHNNHSIRCSEFSSSEDLLEYWIDGLRVDLLFLDIQIPKELSGMLLAQRIRACDHDVPIVFVTNYDDYVYDGYLVNAMRYLRKPVRENDILNCMDTAYRHFTLLTENRFVINAIDERYILKHSEIIYIEAEAHYLSFHLSTSSATPKMRSKIRDVLALLPAQLFIQCHRGFIVNLLHIHRFSKNSIIVSNGQQIPVSKTFFPSLCSAFNKYYQEGRSWIP